MRRDLYFPALTHENSFGDFSLGRSNGKSCLDALKEARGFMAPFGVEKRGIELYHNGMIKDCKCTYGVMRSSYDWALNGYCSDIKFSLKCQSSESLDTYDIELHFLSEHTVRILYDCTCPYCRKNDNKQMCKHIIASLKYIADNYNFDKNNFVIDSGLEPIKNEVISLHNSKITKDVIYGFEPFNQRVKGDVIAKLRLFEKECRYLERGLASMDDDRSIWSDKILRDEFDKLRKDFNAFSNKFLHDTERLIGKGRKGTDDFFLRFECSGNDKTSRTLPDRIEHIDESIACNPFQVGEIKEFQRIIDTYGRETKLKVGTYVFGSKYIYVPNYFELIVLRAKDVPIEFYNSFKLGSKSLSSGIAYSANGETYLLAINILNNYRP